MYIYNGDGSLIFTKRHPTDIIMWVQQNPPLKGNFEITLDKIHIYNLYADCANIPADIWEQFARENEDWGEYFADRRKNRK